MQQVNGDEQQRILGTAFKNVAGEAVSFLVLHSMIRDTVKPVGTIVYRTKIIYSISSVF